MLNSLQDYQDCGVRAAEARNRHDENRYHLENEWFLAAKAREHIQDRIEADRAFHESFNEHRQLINRRIDNASFIARAISP